MLRLTLQRRIVLFILGTTLLPYTLFAAPPYHPTKPQNRDSQANILGDLQHDIENHEVELQMFEERLITQENILDSLRQQVLDTTLANKELVKGNTASIDTRIEGVETSISGLMKDMRQLKNHANDSAKTLASYKKKITDMEQKIAILQGAMDSTLEALQVDAPSSSLKMYTVSSGDTLEKIARKQKTSIKKLKDLNSLTSDRIYVGQKLKLP